MIVVPFTVLIDGREKAPYSFTGLTAPAAKQHQPLLVPSRTCYIETGDYTIDGMESEVAIERKSLEDLYATIGGHRERFERELQRLASMNFSAVVVESTLGDAINRPPEWSSLNPKTVYHSILAWTIRYPVRWLFMEDRRLAEITTFRLLERYLKEKRKDSHGEEQPNQAQPENDRRVRAG